MSRRRLRRQYQLADEQSGEEIASEDLRSDDQFALPAAGGVAIRS
jgi:hypothetical protein